MAGQSNESEALSRPSAGFPFIISRNTEKADPATRKLIRSHVMKGKERKKRGLGKRRGETSGLAPAGLVPMDSTRLRLDEVLELYTPLVPDRIGSDLSCSGAADGVDPVMVFNISRVSPIARRVTFPLMLAVGYRGNQSTSDGGAWAQVLSLDSAFLHATAFAIEQFMHQFLFRQDGFNIGAMVHYSQAVRILRERLLGEDDMIKVSDFTISVVLKLITAAHYVGDFDTSSHHMGGLRRMIELRGGLQTFRGSHLWQEVVRSDLCLAILQGSTPLFSDERSEMPLEYPKQLEKISNKQMSTQDTTDLMERLHSDLATAWLALRRFCLLVNLGAQTKRLVQADTICDTMAAVIYRLLDMSFGPGTLDEAIRCGLLVYSHHLFLQWQHIRPPNPNLPNKFQGCLLSLTRMEYVSSRLVLWFLFAGALSVFDVSKEPWLRRLLQEYLQLCDTNTWRKTQDLLKSFLWIGLLDDDAGKMIFDSLDIHEIRVESSRAFWLPFLTWQRSLLEMLISRITLEAQDSNQIDEKKKKTSGI